MIKFLKIRMSNVTKWSFPSCCPFFKQLVRSFSHPHPLIYMWGVKDSDCHIGSHLLGGVKFIPGQLEIFLALAEKLRLKGLSRNKKLADQEVAKESSKQCESKMELPWQKSSSNVALIITRPSNQWKSLINVPILRQYLGKKFFLRSRWEMYEENIFFCGEEKNRTGKVGKYWTKYTTWLVKWIAKRETIQLAQLCITRWWIV